jgi:hypothetical protein
MHNPIPTLDDACPVKLESLQILAQPFDVRVFSRANGMKLGGTTRKM